MYTLSTWRFDWYKPFLIFKTSLFVPTFKQKPPQKQHNIGWPQLFARQSLGITLAKCQRSEGLKPIKILWLGLCLLKMSLWVKSWLQQLLGKMQVNEPTVFPNSMFTLFIDVLLPNMGFPFGWNKHVCLPVLRFPSHLKQIWAKTWHLYHWLLTRYPRN